MLKVIIEEADEYKAEFYKKWKVRCENSRAVSREKEKVCGLKIFAVLLSMLQIELNLVFQSSDCSCFLKAERSFIQRQIRVTGRRLLNLYRGKFQL